MSFATSSWWQHILFFNTKNFWDIINFIVWSIFRLTFAEILAFKLYATLHWPLFSNTKLHRIFFAQGVFTQLFLIFLFDENVEDVFLNKMLLLKFWTIIHCIDHFFQILHCTECFFIFFSGGVYAAFFNISFWWKCWGCFSQQDVAT